MIRVSLFTIVALSAASAISLGREPLLVPPPVAPEIITSQYAPQPIPETPPPAPLGGTGPTYLSPSYSAPAYSTPSYASPSYPAPSYPTPGMWAPQAAPQFGPGLQPGVILGEAAYLPAVPLYTNVKVRQTRNIAPGAVTKIVSVPDPADHCRCVCIAICVPPCACENILYKRGGDKVRFDYGKYSVDIVARRGHLVVDYND